MWEKLKRYILNILIARDQLWNVYFAGSPDETISSRLWRYRDKWWGRIGVSAVDWVFARLGQKDHCKNSLEPDDHHANDVIK